MSQTLNANLPSGPMMDPATGIPTPAWYAFFVALFNRTGGTQGTNLATAHGVLAAQITAEQAARVAADQTLTSELASEARTRAAGDATLAQELTAEASTRALTDSTLLPRAQLCTQWSQCNLSALLPTTDPGGGLPWNNNGVVTVGVAVGTGNYITAESGTGWWVTEGGLLSWLWG